MTRRLIFVTAVLALHACSGSAGHSDGGQSTTPALNPDAIRRACVVEASCFTTPPISSASACVAQLELGMATGAGVFFAPSANLQRFVECANSATDCTSALQCASQNHASDWCASHSGQGCDGDSLINCQFGWGFDITDCAALGMHCSSANGFSACTDGQACDPGRSLTHCDGNHLVQCDGASMLESNTDCAAAISGGLCTESSATGPGCYPSTAAMCSSPAASCDGNIAIICSAGTVARVDCSQLSSHCSADTSGSFDCVADATDCTAQSMDSCAGTALQICVNGRWTQTPCSSLGLTTCSQTTAGAKCS